MPEFQRKYNNTNKVITDVIDNNSILPLRPGDGKTSITGVIAPTISNIRAQLSKLV